MNPLISPWLRSYLAVASADASPLTRHHSFIRNSLRSQNFANHLAQRYVARDVSDAQHSASAIQRMSTTTPMLVANAAAPYQTMPSQSEGVEEDSALYGNEIEEAQPTSKPYAGQDQAELPQVVATAVHPIEEIAEESSTVQRSPAQLSAELRKTLRRTQKSVTTLGAASAETESQSQPQRRAIAQTDSNMEQPAARVNTHASAMEEEVLSAQQMSGLQSAGMSGGSMVDEVERRIQRAAEQRLLASDLSSDATLEGKGSRFPAQLASTESSASLVDEIEWRIQQAAQRKLDATNTFENESATNVGAGSKVERSQMEPTEIALPIGQVTGQLAGRKSRNSKIYSQVEEIKSLGVAPPRDAPIQTQSNRNRQQTPAPSDAEEEAEPEQEPHVGQPLDVIGRTSIPERESPTLSTQGGAVGKIIDGDTEVDSPPVPPSESDPQTATVLTRPATDKIPRTVDRQPDRSSATFAQGQAQTESTPSITNLEISSESDPEIVTRAKREQPVTNDSKSEVNLPGAVVTNAENNRDRLPPAVASEAAAQQVPTEGPVQVHPPTNAASSVLAGSLESSEVVIERVVEGDGSRDTSVSQASYNQLDNSDDLLQKARGPSLSPTLLNEGLVDKPAQGSMIEPQQKAEGSREQNEQESPSLAASTASIVQRMTADSGEKDQIQTEHETGIDSPITTLGKGEKPISHTPPLPCIGRSILEIETEMVPTDSQLAIQPAVDEGENGHGAAGAAGVVRDTTKVPHRVERERSGQASPAQNNPSGTELKIQRALAEHKNVIATMLRPSQPIHARVDRQVADESTTLPSVIDLSTRPLEKNGAKRKQPAPDLDLLARQITPLVKRLLVIEREREPI